MVFGDKKVSQIPESHIEICGSWLVQASNCHMTTRVFSVIEYKNCNQNSGVSMSCATLDATLDYLLMGIVPKYLAVVLALVKKPSILSSAHKSQLIPSTNELLC